MATISAISRAVSLGVLPTRTPTASSASALAAAVPDEPETIAPACPIRLPAGAVWPAMTAASGLVNLPDALRVAACSSALPPI